MVDEMDEIYGYDSDEELKKEREVKNERRESLKKSSLRSLICDLGFIEEIEGMKKEMNLSEYTIIRMVAWFLEKGKWEEACSAFEMFFSHFTNWLIKLLTVKHFTTQILLF